MSGLPHEDYLANGPIFLAAKWNDIATGQYHQR
jgi:hypothetical protein